ncbi:hypothetical protein [Paraburkholderia ginsengiterrae]|uniref:hypothetical protein n=1 Tax=Paraburkholderia ginsengiterrae TaxID=1462993 RepID=UPI000AD63D69|nr:hypothetical protein [Paraburkholderia ginsengiterrae]
MMPPKTATVCGFIQTVPSYPAFVVPVFRSGHSPWRLVQLVSEGIVRDFIAAPEYDFFVEATSHADSWIGSSPVYGFAYAEHDAFFGKEMDVAMDLFDNRKRLSRNPHVLAEAADFYLHFFQGNRRRNEGSTYILDDLVHESSRRARETLMGVPKSSRRPFRSEVVVARNTGFNDINRIRHLAERSVHVNLWTLSSMVDWVDGVSPDNRMRWFRRVVEDRFSNATHVVVMGTTANPHERRYLDLILDVASSGTSKLVRLSDTNELEQWMRYEEQLRTHSSNESDKEYVANLFGLDEAFGSSFPSKGRSKKSGYSW